MPAVAHRSGKQGKDIGAEVEGASVAGRVSSSYVNLVDVHNLSVVCVNTRRL